MMWQVGKMKGLWERLSKWEHRFQIRHCLLTSAMLKIPQRGEGDEKDEGRRMTKNLILRCLLFLAGHLALSFFL